MANNELQKVRVKINNAALAARKWFQNESVIAKRIKFEKRGRLNAVGSGAVYVYFKQNKALYVGETGRNIKARLYDKTSPHRKKKWWKLWTRVEYVQMQDRTDRLALELFLILSLQPSENTKPGARKMSTLLSSFTKQ